LRLSPFFAFGFNYLKNVVPFSCRPLDARPKLAFGLRFFGSLTSEFAFNGNLFGLPCCRPCGSALGKSPHGYLAESG
jgi:hypothetical protein